MLCILQAAWMKISQISSLNTVVCQPYVTPEPFSSPISGSRQRQGAISCSLGACIPYGMAW